MHDEVLRARIDNEYRAWLQKKLWHDLEIIKPIIVTDADRTTFYYQLITIKVLLLEVWDNIKNSFKNNG